jgi:putative transposase
MSNKSEFPDADRASVSARSGGSDCGKGDGCSAATMGEWGWMGGGRTRGSGADVTVQGRARHAVPYTRINPRRVSVICFMPRPSKGFLYLSDIYRTRYRIAFAMAENLLRRRSVRLPGFDYSQPGQYFVTVCAFQKRCLFGSITDDRPSLSRIGRIVYDVWISIPSHTNVVELDSFVVMPNHIHGILTMKPRARRAVPLPEHQRPEASGDSIHGGSLPEQESHEAFGHPVSGSLSTIIRSYKSETTRQARQLLRNSSFRLWQRGFHESVLRTGDDYANAARYIYENPLRWNVDSENPAATRPSTRLPQTS